MRLNTLAAAAAALWLAAPAAAQPRTAELALGAMEQMAANQGSANDYLLVLGYRDVRVPVYVYREDGGWSSQTQPGTVWGDVLGNAVVWPAVMKAGEGAGDGAGALANAEYLGTETVDGRRAHVLGGSFVTGARLPDSMRVYLDAETRQLLRVVASGRSRQPGNGLPGAGVWMSLDLGDYTASGGVVVPRRIRLRMRMELDPQQRESMRRDVEGLLTALQSDPSPRAGEMRLLMEAFGRMLLGEEMDLPITVEEVRVNAGRPGWFNPATPPDPRP
ncbi:MAG TPA: hypothetical protein VHG08_13250 [Longimicrobium sp.]|nr:hypothetical protein [Longimicrobium sp.]